MARNFGPLELLVLGFEDDKFRGEIARSVRAAAATDAIRVVDLIFVRKDGSENITAFEVEESGQAAREFAALGADIRGVLTDDDAMTLAKLLPANTAALVVLVEHKWALDVAEAVQRAGGKLLASQRIGRGTVELLGDDLDRLLSAH